MILNFVALLVSVFLTLGLQTGVSAPADSIGPIDPVLMEDVSVSKEFADLGSMHRIGDRVWSGVHPTRMSHEDASSFCQSVGGRLPARREYELLAKVMGAGSDAGYQRQLLPDMDGSFWASTGSLRNSLTAYCFRGSHGDTGVSYRHAMKGVRCIWGELRGWF